MKRGGLLLAFALMIVTAFLGSHHVSAEDSNQTRITIGFKDTIDTSIIENISTSVIHHEHEAIKAITASVPSAEIPDLRSHPKVAWVENDQEVSISSGPPPSETPSQMTDWGYEETIDINTVKLNITGNGVKIGIIDTGISLDHPDLEVAGGVSVVPDTTTYSDDNGHGTHVAGIIAAKDNDIGALGVAPNAEIYSIKALDEFGEGNQADVVAGIEWAIEQDIDVLNLSLTNPRASLALKQMTENATEAGIILVAASGNNETEQDQASNDIMYPAQYDTVIGVGSVDRQLNRSPFSYVGSSLEYVAPGEDIFSTYRNTVDGTNYYARLSGTSMAAPFVTGIIALYKEVYPDLDAKELKNIMAESAEDLGDPGRDAHYGYGLIQSPETLFRDVEKEMWYSNAITYLKQQSYLDGYPDGTFRPDGSITRGEAVKMVGDALELNGSKQPTSYDDVGENHFASGYIVEATEQGWITGYPNNEFKADDPITRGDVALIIGRAFDISPSNQPAFTDVTKNDYYYAAINGLYHQELITGYETGHYEPTKHISRAEFSLILTKVLNVTFR